MGRKTRESIRCVIKGRDEELELVEWVRVF